MISSKKKSISTTNYTTNNTDKRVANQSGLVATEGSNITYTALDGDAINSAFEFASGANAVNGDGFEKLLGVTERLMTKSSDTATTLSSRFQDNVMQAFETAKTAATGSIDQKTMILLAVAAAAVVIVPMVYRKKAA